MPGYSAVKALVNRLVCAGRPHSRPGKPTRVRSRGETSAGRQTTGVPRGYRARVQNDDPWASDADRLRAATEILEEIVRDRGLLGSLTVEERTRLIAAAGDLYNPDLEQRR